MFLPTNMNDKAAEWSRLDLPTRLAQLFRVGWGIDQKSGRIKPLNPASGWDTPWIYTKGIDSKRCTLDHTVKFDLLGYIPPKCLTCWKVVVMPKTYADLHRLLKIERGMDVPCKCGIEVREYTSRNYGGYFYCTSLEEGRDRHAQVSKLVKDGLEEETPVILKRGCTEYEAKKGASAMWSITKDQLKTDEMIDMYVDVQPMVNGRQTEFQVAHVMQKWIRWAHSHADFSYTMHNGGEQITNPPVMYHEGDLEGIKNELAIAKAYSTAQAEGAIVDPEVLKNYRELTLKYSQESDVPIEHLVQSMSYEPAVTTGADQTT